MKHNYEIRDNPENRDVTIAFSLPGLQLKAPAQQAPTINMALVQAFGRDKIFGVGEKPLAWVRDTGSRNIMQLLNRLPAAGDLSLEYCYLPQLGFHVSQSDSDGNPVYGILHMSLDLASKKEYLDDEFITRHIVPHTEGPHPLPLCNWAPEEDPRSQKIGKEEYIKQRMTEFNWLLSRSSDLGTIPGKGLGTLRLREFYNSERGKLDFERIWEATQRLKTYRLLSLDATGLDKLGGDVVATIEELCDLFHDLGSTIAFKVNVRDPTSRLIGLEYTTINVENPDGPRKRRRVLSVHNVLDECGGEMYQSVKSDAAVASERDAFYSNLDDIMKSSASVATSHIGPLGAIAYFRGSEISDEAGCLTNTSRVDNIVLTYIDKVTAIEGLDKLLRAIQSVEHAMAEASGKQKTLIEKATGKSHILSDEEKSRIISEVAFRINKEAYGADRTGMGSGTERIPDSAKALRSVLSQIVFNKPEDTGIGVAYDLGCASGFTSTGYKIMRTLALNYNIDFLCAGGTALSGFKDHMTPDQAKVVFGEEGNRTRVYRTPQEWDRK